MTVVAAPRSVLIMAGGTGGHVFPALAVAKYLMAKGINVEWLGTKQGIEAKLVAEANIPIHFIRISGLRGKGIVGIFKSLLQVFGALVQAIKVLNKVKPICILGMGGFVSGPGGLAAWLSRKPLVIHEQNSVAGTTNKLLAKIASRILLGYPIQLGKKKSRYVGNPVREEIAALPAPSASNHKRSESLRILILGGSLGAKPINDVVPKALQLIDSSKRPVVWHQTGTQHVEAVRSEYKTLDVEGKVEAFIDDVAAAYEWADLVVCRAGALTIAELTAAGVASVLVPLPHAIDDHQTENARWLVDNNAALLLKQTGLNDDSLSQLFVDLSEDSQQLVNMAVAARKLAKTDSVEQVAGACMEVANG